MDTTDDRHEGNVGDEAPEPGLAAEPPGDQSAEEHRGARRRGGEQAAERRRDAATAGTAEERRPVVAGDGGGGGERGQGRPRRRRYERADRTLGDVEAAGDGERSEPGDVVQGSSRDRAAAD